MGENKSCSDSIFEEVKASHKLLKVIQVWDDIYHQSTFYLSTCDVLWVALGPGIVSDYN